MHSEPRDLPDDLELPLASGEAWWYWLGGRPAMDLVNTRRERWNRSVETLVTPSDLSGWLAAAGVADPGLRVPAEVLGEARALREALDALVVATVDGRPPGREALRTVDHWLIHAGTRPRLTAEDGVPVLGERAAADSARRALGTVALDAAHMLGTDERARVRICASPTCSARFYDRSPAGARRWCSMQTCGNQDKARRHRARRREATA